MIMSGHRSGKYDRMFVRGKYKKIPERLEPQELDELGIEDQLDRILAKELFRSTEQKVALKQEIEDVLEDIISRKD